jgi:hypothetical protein
MDSLRELPEEPSQDWASRLHVPACLAGYLVYGVNL